MKVEILFLLSITILISVHSNNEVTEKEFIICYHSHNQTSWILDQDSFSIANKSEKCCVTGIWMLYTKEAYEGKAYVINNSGFYRPNTPLSVNCFDLPKQMMNKIRSVRYIGIPGLPNESFVTVFKNAEFRGEAYVIKSSEPRLIIKGSIIIGCGIWTLYDEEDYKGNCQYYILPNDCLPATFKDMTKGNPGINLKSIKSINRGYGCNKPIELD